MAIGNVAAQNDVLDAWLGTTRAAHIPDAYDIEPWCGDPRDDDSAIASEDGVDLEPVSWDSDDWDDAAAGEKQTNADVTWSLSEGTDDEVTHWALRNQTSGNLAYSDALTEAVFPLGAGTLAIRPTITCDDGE